MKSELEEFAKTLVEQVRDAAIRVNDRNLEGKDVIAKRWQAAAASGSPESFAKVLIPDVVDSTIAHLLHAIDQELLRLSFNTQQGKVIDLTTVATESGELTGWYGGSGGWADKYTEERFNDNTADLRYPL